VGDGPTGDGRAGGHPPLVAGAAGGTDVAMGAYAMDDGTAGAAADGPPMAARGRGGGSAGAPPPGAAGCAAPVTHPLPSGSSGGSSDVSDVCGDGSAGGARVGGEPPPPGSKPHPRGTPSVDGRAGRK